MFSKIVLILDLSHLGSRVDMNPAPDLRMRQFSSKAFQASLLPHRGPRDMLRHATSQSFIHLSRVSEVENCLRLGELFRGFDYLPPLPPEGNVAASGC